MHYALISDIHGNEPALAAVLDHIAHRSPAAATYHLGDLVGYGPAPNEVVQLLLSRGIPGVAGNYDSTVATSYQHCGCRYEDPKQEALSHVSFEWTKSHASEATRSFLGTLPFRIDLRPLGGHLAGPTVFLLHGNQVLNTVYVTEDRPDDFLEKMATALSAKGGDVVCFGHTHIPWHRIVRGVHFVNTGSVGRPKDGDWRACYALLTIDETRVSVEFVRVEYEVERVVKAIQESGLSAEFAEQLRTGGKPVVLAGS
ncbi:MAG TPA: metallophosphoesterase family protein [Gemmatimonadales bacterium]|jgi:predicted phosphodiesterase|nr:metallophosphoesterase family protein [Gemmatimonadales bacterium]